MRGFNSSSRRGFLKSVGIGSAIAANGYWTSSAVAQSKSALEKLHVACIGTANRAGDDIQGVKHESIVALCDVDKSYLDRALKDFPSARGYQDYRELIDREGSKIDAVVVAVADHHHAPASMRAIQAGKHVYCEKPLSHTVAESRLLAEAAKAKGVATQLGTQIHAEENYRRVVEIIEAGTIGPISEVHVWVAKIWGGGDRPQKVEQPPANLNWDLWLGPAPERPFASGRYHPAQWRKWWDFGTGTLGDMGCHFMDLPFWALKLRHPSTIEAEGSPVHPETAPTGLKVQYEFPAAEGRGPVKFTWYDGERIPRELGGQRVPADGVMFVGERGMMFANYSSYKFFPADKFAGFEPPPKSIPRSIGHHKEWLKACRDGSPTTCNFDYSGALTECVLLGTVAYRVGKKITWDAANLKAVGLPEADKFLKKEYRSGWAVG